MEAIKEDRAEAAAMAKIVMRITKVQARMRIVLATRKVALKKQDQEHGGKVAKVQALVRKKSAAAAVQLKRDVQLKATTRIVVLQAKVRRDLVKKKLTIEQATSKNIKN